MASSLGPVSLHDLLAEGLSDNDADSRLLSMTVTTDEQRATVLCSCCLSKCNNCCKHKAPEYGLLLLAVMHRDTASS